MSAPITYPPMTRSEQTPQLEPATAPGPRRGHRLWRWTRKAGVLVVGVAMLIAGAAMLVLPGPGILVIVAGLGVLATEFAWAARLLARVKDRARRAGRAVRERRPRRR